jgi:hypothetical protein
VLLAGLPAPLKAPGTNSVKSSYRWPAVSLAFTLPLGGCADRTPATDAWLGQWNGPEGTFLRLEGGNGRYEVTIRDLDGARTYEGTAKGAEIQFDRNGKRETIRATDGAETGMKWLSDKSDCLTIRPGEGYCRD